MNHIDHVNLLRPAALAPGGTWADLGAGSGAFTLALRELLGPQAEIYAVDQDAASLNELSRAFGKRFKGTAGLHVLEADFRRSLKMPPLDGVLMANSLHFHKKKAPILRQVRGLLKPGGTLLVVEYNVDRGNPWVPFPFSYETFKDLAAEAGFDPARLLTMHPSSFLREFYSAAAKAP
ncbi:MAG TPA: class I SAM-dependent methyltransferase [Anaerolineales bacterium]|nr:class I SAM-dependent methyltransferase [Anaerolineales bacterium]